MGSIEVMGSLIKGAEVMFKTRKSRKAGFTLVELMVVAIIVAILAAVAIPLMSGNKTRAMATEAETALGTIRTQLRVMYAETGTYSSNQNNIAVTSITNVPGVNLSDLTGKYWPNTAYTFSTAPSGAVGTNYVLQANGNAAGCDPALAGVLIKLDANGNFIRTGL